MNKNKQNPKEKFTHKVGDKIERVGEILREKGARKLGDAVYRAGNKIEHYGDEEK